MTTLAVTSVNSLLCQASTCFRIGSKFRCIRSTPTEMQSISENDFECFASTGVNTRGTMLPNCFGRSPSAAPRDRVSVTAPIPGGQGVGEFTRRFRDDQANCESPTSVPLHFRDFAPSLSRFLRQSSFARTAKAQVQVRSISVSCSSTAARQSSCSGSRITRILPLTFMSFFRNK